MRPSDAVCRSLIERWASVDAAAEVEQKGNAKTGGVDSKQDAFDVYFSVMDKFNFRSVFLWRFTRLCFSRCVLVGDYIIWLLPG